STCCSVTDCRGWFASDVPASSAGQPPGTARPLMGRLESGKPLIGSPLIGNPLIGRPLIGSPLIGNPLIGSPLIGNPLIGRPLMGRPLIGAGVAPFCVGANAPSGIVEIASFEPDIATLAPLERDAVAPVALPPPERATA